jgi:N6-L-threonylcarbamoyladenine synthase
LFRTTHQEGHLRAALAGTPDPPPAFIAVHLSGGTTEFLSAVRTTNGYTLAPLGGSSDLHAGQFVDRLGVAMGLPFPAGPALEELARQGRPGALSLPVAVDGMRLSLSGPLTAAERLLARGADRADLAAAAFACLIASVGRLLQSALAQTGLRDVVLGGGVTANRALREDLTRLLPGIRLIFARPGLATDGAVGVALLGREMWQAGHE